MSQKFQNGLICLCLGVLLVACGPILATSMPTPTATPAREQPKKIILRNWEGDIAPEILEQFRQETGITVEYLPYESQEQAVEDIRAGQVFDVVVLENQLIPSLINDNLLPEIDLANVPNFKNISANFRDLSYDPGNRHSLPYSWGTTGLVVRTDLVGAPVTRWADLWRPELQGKLMGWALSRYIIGLTLKSLGYSLNSEDPQQLDKALEKMIELRPGISLVEWKPAVSAPHLISGEVWVAIGQADDVIEGQKENKSIRYIMPAEGGLLWGDNFTIPANSPNKTAAEALINFLLRDQVAARIINNTFYWLPNDAALPLVKPEIRDNPAIFPPADSLKAAEILLPLSPRGEELYAHIWKQFLGATR